MFKWKKNKSEQRGTLMVEAIAMLGLIAIVTPTLYKKSAERLQEIQDINIASQARTMAGVIETFIRNKASMFEDYAQSSGVSIFELCKDDHCSSQADHLGNFLHEGYSSAIPYGFKPQDVKYFGEPRVFVVSEEGNIVFYIVYPKQMDLGKRRATRLASLIGAQGGIITKDVNNKDLVQGTGGAWELDKDMIKDVFEGDASSLVTENSLVLTNSEPITTKFEDTEKFLYRIPPTDQEDYFHNTMVTDLYLGGNEEDLSLYSSHSREYYSIFNVRKMTLNTRCTAARINVNGVSSSPEDCDPDVADLYIGKPTGLFAENPRTPGTSGPGTEKKYSSNTGAAWIYGNLSALNERFKLYNTQYNSSGTSYDRVGYDILQFSHDDVVDSSSGDVALGNSVFMASNEDGKGQVAMIDGMVRAVENFEGKEGSSQVGAFLVGGDSSSVNEDDGRLITAFEAPTGGRVNINDFDERAITRINSRGGDVYINGGDSASADSELTAHTYINPNSGELLAGKHGQWLYAGGMEDSAHVDVFSSGVGNRFTVGGITADSSQIWANSSLTSLRDGAIRAYNFSGSLGNVGGFDLVDQYETANSLSGDNAFGSSLTNAAVIGAKYTDILGPAYFGTKGQMESDLDSSKPFKRDDWRLAVAGSAWVDELLYANKAWFNSTGVKELHAGFERFTEFEDEPRKAWLNAYEDGVIIRDRESVTDTSGTGVGGVRPADTRFYANSTDVYMGDSKGAMARLNDGVALFGYAKDLSSSAIPALHNYVGADSTAAFVVGNKLAQIYTSSDAVDDENVAVDIQKGAMLFQGYSWASDSTRTEHNYNTNTINAHAGQFAVHTRPFQDSSGNIINDARGGVLYADSSDVLTRVVDFSVQDNKGEHVLKARPMIDDLNSSEANVEVDGSFHVTGNRVIHVASSEHNKAGETAENPHAMFEVDPNYVRVMALDDNDSTYVAGRDRELAMFEVNPYDIDGSSTVTRNEVGMVTNYADDPTENASVYIRRGAIELERSREGSSWAADEGSGYIKANRFVSNADGVFVPVIGTKDAKETPYDQYMVNPAYTSVMHDIKLTTRGGARLSDVLPDYVLKGVYNVSNDYLEDGITRIRWSCGPKCKQPTVSSEARWASPYVGVIPYAVCPPGYRNMATIVPISFEMGQAGQMVKAGTYNEFGGTSGKYVINRTPRQSRILGAGAGNDLFYPQYNEVQTFQYNRMVSSATDFNPKDDLKSWIAGWYLGPSANMDSTKVQAESKLEWEAPDNVAKYFEDKNSGSYQIVAEPLYFQQNTFLKTSVVPGDEGWDGRMGFVYDKTVYGNNLGGLGNDGIISNNNPQGYNGGGAHSLDNGMYDNYVWNLFPVPTNTLEGHATVYCYFDRTSFLGEDLKGTGSNWKGLIDPIDQINNPRIPDSTGATIKTDSEYVDRLNDPTLKYRDPW